MKKSLKIPLLIALLTALFFASHPRFYNGLNTGIAWDIGGIELRGNPGLFLCEANYNPTTGESWHNPLSNLFPSLVVDC